MRMNDKIKTLKEKLQKMKVNRGEQTDWSDVSFFSILKETETGADMVVQRITGTQ